MPLSGTISAEVTHCRCSVACCRMRFSSSAPSPAAVREPAESVSSSSRSLSSERDSVRSGRSIADACERDRGADIRVRDAAARARARSCALRLASPAFVRHTIATNRHEHVLVIAQPEHVDGQIAVEHAELAGAFDIVSCGREARARPGAEIRARWSSRSTSAARRSRRTRQTLPRAAAANGRAVRTVRTIPRDRVARRSARWNHSCNQPLVEV